MTGSLSYEEIQKNSCKAYNERPGELNGIDCPICKNRGNFREYKGGEIVTVECSCMAARRSLWRAQKSGLGELIDRCTLDSFKAGSPWQEAIKQKAINFLADGSARWLYFGGQPGAGKTHICAAIAGELLKAGLYTRYMMWRDDSTRIKAAVTDPLEYKRLVDPLKSADVLYIDDLFKSGGKWQRPSAGDINLAFEIINYRYNSREKYTIISSECSWQQLLAADEAIASRIAERTQKKYLLSVLPDATKNYRTGGKDFA